MSVNTSASSYSVLVEQHEATLKRSLKKISKTNDEGKELARIVLESTKNATAHDIEQTVHKIVKYQFNCDNTADACKCFPILRHLEYYGEGTSFKIYFLIFS